MLCYELIDHVNGVGKAAGFPVNELWSDLASRPPIRVPAAGSSMGAGFARDKLRQSGQGSRMNGSSPKIPQVAESKHFPQRTQGRKVERFQDVGWRCRQRSRLAGPSTEIFASLRLCGKNDPGSPVSLMRE